MRNGCKLRPHLTQEGAHHQRWASRQLSAALRTGPKLKCFQSPEPQSSLPTKARPSLSCAPVLEWGPSCSDILLGEVMTGPDPGCTGPGTGPSASSTVLKLGQPSLSHGPQRVKEDRNPGGSALDLSPHRSLGSIRPFPDLLRTFQSLRDGRACLAPMAMGSESDCGAHV
jgi:hypothetical protein